MKKRIGSKVLVCGLIAFLLAFTAIVVTPVICPQIAEAQAAAKPSISKKALTLYVKKTSTLKVKNYSGKVKWTTSNAKVAKVSQKGKVTALKKGIATITAKAGKKKYTCKVTVKNPVLSAASLTLTAGKTQKLIVKNAIGTVKWTSDNPSIAAVSSKGIVSAKKTGTTTVTAVASGVKLRCKVTVKAATVSVTGVSLDQTDLKLMIGENRILTATVIPANASNRALTWESSNPDVAEIVDGFLTATGTGEAVITVKTADGNKSAACKVQVSDPELIGTYYMFMNVNQDLSPVGGAALTEPQQAEVRNALQRLLDRTFIVDIVTSDDYITGGAASTFVSRGITEPDGSQFYQSAGHSAAYNGYYPVEGDTANAWEVLQNYYTVENGKLTDFPVLQCIANDITKHQVIASYVQDTLNNIGITMEISVVDGKSYYSFLEEREFHLARGGWIVDHNDALELLSLFASGSDNNYANLGKGSHAAEAVYSLDLSGLSGYEGKSVTEGTWAETYDLLLACAETEDNPKIRSALLHKAEDLLMETGAVWPLYYY